MIVYDKEQKEIVIPNGIGNINLFNNGVEAGYNQGKIDGINEQKSKLESINITENGTYTKEDGYNHIEVNVPNLNVLTYTELKSLRDAGKLVPGTQYRITDYTCTTTQSGTKSAGHQFDIIVTADDESTLNEEARAALHTGDEYFSGCSLNAWKIWYCLDNDFERFEWAIVDELIGTIKPTTGSASGTYTYSSPISNIMVYSTRYTLEIGVRTQIAIGPSFYITKTDDYTLVVEDTYSFVTNVGISVYTDSKEGKGVIYRMIDEFGNDCPYDFKNIQFYRKWDSGKSLWSTISSDNTGVPCYTFSSTGNSTTTSFKDKSLASSNNVYSNVIGKYVSSNKQTLNNNCFFGNNCCGNIFGNDCNNNTFGNGCYSNTFGNGCYSNTFGNSFKYSTFGNGCYSNTFENNCDGNTFGNYCYSNTFGNYCSRNTFGNYCSHINFASDSSASTKYNYYRSNHFGDGCRYIVFTGAETASNSAQVQNYNFAQGLQGTRNAYLTIDGVRNLSYETKVAKNSNGEIKIYCEADLIL